jgi:hypothetical protein
MVPFHDLWIDGGGTDKRPPCPPSAIQSVQNHGSYLWDTTPSILLRFHTIVSVEVKEVPNPLND